MSQENVEIVREAWRAFIERGVDGVIEYYAEGGGVWATTGPEALNPMRPNSALQCDAPSRIRTCGLLLRRESLYPTELSGLTPADRRGSRRPAG
jgi:hypothetical protein